MDETGIWGRRVLSKVIHAQKGRWHMLSFLKNPSFNFMGLVFILRVLVEAMKLKRSGLVYRKDLRQKDCKTRVKMEDQRGIN